MFSTLRTVRVHSIARYLILPMLAIAAMLASAGTSYAAEPVALPTLGDGTSVALYIGFGFTALGAVVAVAIGGNVAFKVIKAGLKWIFKAFGS